MINNKSSHVSLATKISFGLGGFGKDFGLVVINTFLFFYYTDVVGVSAAFIGTVFLFARIWDTVNDPMLGYLVNKTRTRWGKYKPWILAGNILNAVFIVALFSAHLLEGTQQAIYIAVTYVGWGMTYTMLDAPFWSLLPTITLDKNEREQLMPYPRLFASTAGYIVGGAGVWIIATLGAGVDGQGYMLFGLIAAVLAIASAIITCIWTKQMFADNDEATKSFTLKDVYILIFKNEQFIALLVLALLYNIATNMTGGLNLYFFTYVLKNKELFSTTMVWAGVSGIASLVFFPKIVQVLGRRKMFTLALLFPMVASFALFFAANYAPDSMILIAITGICFGITSAIYWLIILIMVADTVDYGDYKFGIRSESISYSIHTLTSKCSGAFTGYLVGIGLTMINYIPNQEQTAETITGLQFIYLTPAVLCLVSLVIYTKIYKLNDDKLDEVERALKEKYALES